MSARIVPSCGGCVCFEEIETGTLQEVGSAKQGQCHRFPPQIVAVSHKTLQGMALVPGAMFPQVSAKWWCGEFRPKGQGTES